MTRIIQPAHATQPKSSTKPLFRPLLRLSLRQTKYIFLAGSLLCLFNYAEAAPNSSKPQSSAITKNARRKTNKPIQQKQQKQPQRTTNKNKTKRKNYFTNRYASNWYNTQASMRNQYFDPGIANALDWKKTGDNLCHGYYFIPDTVTKYPNPLPANTQPTNISSAGPIVYLRNDLAKATGNVIITQQGRYGSADVGYIYYNKQGFVKKIRLVGHAKLQQPHQLLAGNTITWDLSRKTAWVKNGVYRLESIKGKSWGTAERGVRLPGQITELYNATYTTCPPNNPCWRLAASHIHLNKKTGIGSATNGTLFLTNVPIFYLPYYRFPIDNRRHTGFLSPFLGHSSTEKWYFGWPFYWNIAPNLDMLITPSWQGIHRFKLDDTFRFLTKHTEGSISGAIVPDDAGFMHTRDILAKNYAGSQYIDSLNNIHLLRWYINAQENININEKWHGNLQISQVSDDYYLQTFGANIDNIRANALPSSANFYYTGFNWNWHLGANTYQNLYPVDASVGDAPYARLPVLDGSANYPYLLSHLSAAADWQATYFSYIAKYQKTPLTDGTRMHSRPGFSLPFNFASANITPAFWYDLTSYDLKLPNGAPKTQNNDPSRALPIFDIDNNYYSEIHWNVKDHRLLQTFEPELFYLYVPYKDQSQLPNFDSITKNSFGPGNLIALNEFNGYDRLQNANQLSMGLTSRWISEDSGTQYASFKAGLIRYFDARQVGKYDDKKWSPLAVGGTFNWGKLSISADTAWDLTPVFKLNNSNTTVALTDDAQDLISLTYNFTPNGDLDRTTNEPIDYRHLTLGAAKHLGEHWQTEAYWDYNIGHKFTPEIYAGVSYEACCWMLRVMTARNYIGNENPSQKKYKNTFFIQLLLKGLGFIGRDPGGQITDLPGFKDPFGNDQRKLM